MRAASCPLCIHGRTDQPKRRRPQLRPTRQESSAAYETDGDNKPDRQPDLTFKKPDDTFHYEQIGRTDSEGIPAPRELNAIEDLFGAGGDVDYVHYEWLLPTNPFAGVGLR